MIYASLQSVATLQFLERLAIFQLGRWIVQFLTRRKKCGTVQFYLPLVATFRPLNHTFLVSCFICNEEYSRNRTMVFTQCVGVHKLTLIDFPVKSIIASMTEDWMSGLNFKLKRHERDVATIRLSTSNYFQ